MNAERTPSKQAIGVPLNVQSFTFMVPVKRFSADVDYSKKVTVPAILESALGLIDCLEELSLGELQDYFGLNDLERESLLEIVESSGFAQMNQNGCLVPTARMREFRLTNNGKYVFDEVDNHSGDFSVDLLTNYIQPIAEDGYIIGLHVIPTPEEAMEVDPYAILTRQFPRFQQCSKRLAFQAASSKLYRINRCIYDQITLMPVSIDIVLKLDAFGNPNTESKIFGYSSEHEQLVSSSGLIPKIQDYLNKRQGPSNDQTIEEYCSFMHDGVLRSYIENGKVNFRKLLNEATDHEDPLTRLLIGPCYLEENKQLIISSLQNLKTSGFNLPPMLWLPGHDDLWGSSLRLRTFANELDQELKQYNSKLMLVLPGIDVYDEKEYKLRFKNVLNNGVLLQNASPLSNIEILLLDSDPGLAIVQYHVFIKSDLGLGGYSIPLGYVTQNKVHINRLRDHLKLWGQASTSLKSIIDRSSVAGVGGATISEALKNIMDFFDMDFDEY